MKSTISRTVLAILLGIFFHNNLTGQFLSDAVRYTSPGNGVGIKALGMGRAFTGVADDYSALYYNPAGLALIRKSELNISGAFHYSETMTTYLDRSSNGSKTNFSPLSATGVFPIPVFQGSFVLAIGYHQIKNFLQGHIVQAFTPSNTITKNFRDNYVPAFDTDGKVIIKDYGAMAWETYLQNVDRVANRYIESVVADKGNVTVRNNLIETGSMNELVLGGAMEIAEGFFVGLNLSYVFGDYSFERAYQEIAKQDVHTNFQELILDEVIKVRLSGWTGQVAILYKKNNLRLGLNINLPTILNVNDKSESALGVVYLNKPSENAESVNPGSTLAPLEIQYTYLVPPSIYFGASYLFDNKFLASFDIGYRDYSQGEFRGESHKLLNRKLKEELNPLGFEFALGLEYRFTNVFIVRAGVNYLSPPYQKNLSQQLSSFSEGYITSSLGTEVIIGKSIAINTAFFYTLNKNETTLYSNSPIVVEDRKWFGASLGVSYRF